MTCQPTAIAGLPISCDARVFLALLAVHVPLGVLSLGAGIVAMFAAKQAGRHPRAGTVYYWSLAALVLTSAALAAMRWNQDAYLFGLGALALGSATFGRLARRRLWKHWMPIHAIGMGFSYIVMVTAFYVDNGKNLPLWRDLPTLSYWLGPLGLGTPLIAWSLWRRRPLL